jgi:hypothetical protein
MLEYFSLLFMSVVLCCVSRVYFIIFGPVAYGACCAVCVLWLTHVKKKKRKKKCREIICIYRKIHVAHKNVFCGQNVKL